MYRSTELYNCATGRVSPDGEYPQVPQRSISGPLPNWLYTREAAVRLDRLAQELDGVSGDELMRRAGAASFTRLRRQWPQAKSLVVLCGGGNNGGDGYVVAALARRAGLRVQLFALKSPESLSAEAANAARLALDAGVVPHPFDPSLPNTGADLVVDALLGTGVDRPVSSVYGAAIDWINACPCPVMALDVPSGLNADTGVVLGTAVRADLTVTFIALKRGLFTGAGPDHVGLLVFDRLGVSKAPFQQITQRVARYRYPSGLEALPGRARDAHKGRFGHCLVVGGNRGMGGAALLAGLAAVRTGSGLVSLATRPTTVVAAHARAPELMARAVRSGPVLAELVSRASVLTVGPGLGQDTWARSLWAQVLEARLPLVVDADALNLLAELKVPPYRNDWILTPHPGEAARLLGTSVAAVEADRFAAASALQQRHGGAVVLKGVGTLVATPGGRLSLCDGGNPGMASGGMGDLLTGVISGLCAQGLDVAQAATLGVALHAEAGDCAAASGERGLIASDLLPALRVLVNGARPPDKSGGGSW